MTDHPRSQYGVFGTSSAHRKELLLLLFAFISFLHTPYLSAQSKHPLIISGGTHALTFPWYPGQITKRFNPSLTIGSERTLRPPGKIRLYQTVNLGFFRHYWWVTSVFINTELGISRHLPYGFHSDLKAGIGYMHTFWRRETLKLHNGEYVSATDWGRPSAMVPLSFILGHRGGTIRNYTMSPFITMQWVIQAPFVEEIPAMTHVMVLFGVRLGRKDITRTGGQ